MFDKKIFTDDMLKAVLCEIRDEELQRAEKDIEDMPAHQFSPRHIKRMNHIFQQDRDQKVPKAWKRALLVLSAALVLFFSTVMAVGAWRAEFFRIIEEVYDKFSHMFYEQVETHGTIQPFEEYYLTQIPDGFSVHDEYVNAETREKYVLYKSETDKIIFYQMDAEGAAFDVNTENVEKSPITIGDKECYFFYNQGMNYIGWNDCSYAMLIVSSLNKKETVNLVKHTKKSDFCNIV